MITLKKLCEINLEEQMIRNYDFKQNVPLMLNCYLYSNSFINIYVWPVFLCIIFEKC